MLPQFNLSSLRAALPQADQVLTDPFDADFQRYSKSWSDINAQTPGAIVLPRTEAEIQRCVELTSSFVTRSAGHSEYSHIGSDGVLISLANYSDIEIDEEACTATLCGSILSKEVNDRLAEKDLCAALGNGNEVGAIAYLLGGGHSTISSVAGFGADQILSARMVTARGDLVEISDASHPDLLTALRGAGLFFGLITSLTIRVHSTSILGPSGTIWQGIFAFPLKRAEEVASVLQSKIVNNSRHHTAGMLMLSCPPPHHAPALVVSARLYGTSDPDDVQAAFGAIEALKPILSKGEFIPLNRANDATAFLDAKGGFKRFVITGYQSFDLKRWLATIPIYEEMVRECPDAKGSAFGFQWFSRPIPRPDEIQEGRTAITERYRSTRFWQNNYIAHTTAANQAKIDTYGQKVVDVMRDGTAETEYVDFLNGHRGSPLERRYGRNDEAVLSKLREVKKKWDPTGRFGRQFLDH